MTDIRDKKPDANRDPITGAPGSHPVGTGIGAAAGGLAGGAAAGALSGAAMGTAAGPVGTLVGTAAGAIVGGLMGKAAAEHFDPTVEDAYWKGAYNSEPYYQSGLTYDDYAPAYRTGYEGRNRYQGKKFDEVEKDLAADYNRNKGKSSLTWENGKSATRAAWDRIERAIPGDADHDGK